MGILGNGAGLVMSTLDVVAQAGGEPANFCDVGGGADADTISQALDIVTSNEKSTASSSTSSAASPAATRWRAACSPRSKTPR